MLFCRRKAEIEVLGAARTTQQSIADLTRDASFPHRGFDRKHAARSPRTPLLHYLIKKIGDACGQPECSGDK